MELVRGDRLFPLSAFFFFLIYYYWLFSFIDRDERWCVCSFSLSSIFCFSLFYSWELRRLWMDGGSFVFFWRFGLLFFM